jgi:hypothetical protein
MATAFTARALAGSLWSVARRAMIGAFGNGRVGEQIRVLDHDVLGPSGSWSILVSL